jgi:hypothetical protein
MKKTLIISLLVAAMGVITFVSCEKEDTIENPTTAVASQTTDNPSQSPVTHNTELSYTQCKSHGQKDIPEETISTNYENGILQIMVEDMCISCGVYTVVAESEIDAQTITVDFDVIYESQANCICLIDADYSIDNIKPGNYELIIRESSLVVYQEEITCSNQSGEGISEENIFAENREFSIGNSECNKLVYNGRYGNDFNSAVDSLRRICRLDEYEDGYEVMREPILNVHFNYDDRSFYSVWFQNENYLSEPFWLDDRGNNYDHLFCDD